MWACYDTNHYQVWEQAHINRECPTFLVSKGPEWGGGSIPARGRCSNALVFFALFLSKGMHSSPPGTQHHLVGITITQPIRDANWDSQVQAGLASPSPIQRTCQSSVRWGLVLKLRSSSYRLTIVEWPLPIKCIIKEVTVKVKGPYETKHRFGPQVVLQEVRGGVQLKLWAQHQYLAYCRTI